MAIMTEVSNSPDHAAAVIFKARVSAVDVFHALITPQPLCYGTGSRPGVNKTHFIHFSLYTVTPSA